jgi:hypothetical protein
MHKNTEMMEIDGGLIALQRIRKRSSSMHRLGSTTSEYADNDLELSLWLQVLEDTVQLHGEHHVTLDLELAACEQLLTALLASSQSNEVLLSNGDGDITLASTLGEGTSTILQVQGTDDLTVGSLDVEDEHSLGLLDQCLTLLL